MFYKTEFRLKQHTPLIHFHNHEGATLRATELKPKLDRFLIEKLEKDEVRDWLISGQDSALDYKVKVNSKNVKCEFISKDNKIPMYLGNMAGKGKEGPPKFLSITEDVLEVIISTFNKELSEALESNLACFIGRTNFGTRQNKGFGSFYLHESCEYFDDYQSIPTGTFKLIPTGQNIKDYIDIFNIINYYFQRLKSGINYSAEYQHSFLKLYLADSPKTDYEWEKKWVKENFLGAGTSMATKKFARAMLGLSDKIEFKKPKDNRKYNNGMGQVYPENDFTISIAHNEGNDENKIARFKSPLTFKPIKDRGGRWSIYVYTNKIQNGMINKEFKFLGNGEEAILSTPPEAIDLNDLLKKYHEHLNHNFTATTFTGRDRYNIRIEEI